MKRQRRRPEPNHIDEREGFGRLPRRGWLRSRGNSRIPDRNSAALALDRSVVNAIAPTQCASESQGARTVLETWLRAKADDDAPVPGRNSRRSVVRLLYTMKLLLEFMTEILWRWDEESAGGSMETDELTGGGYGKSPFTADPPSALCPCPAAFILRFRGRKPEIRLLRMRGSERGH